MGRCIIRSFSIQSTSFPSHLRRTADALLDWSHLEPWRRRGLVMFLLDGLAVIFVMSFAATYVPLYALAMGATSAEIGWLSSATSLGVIGGAVLSPRLVRLLGSTKRVVVICARAWEALSYLLLLAIPFFFAGATAVRVLIAFYLLRTTIGEAGVPAWSAFIPGLVPIGIRGRFMSLRSVLKMLALMIIIPLAGSAITALGGYPAGYQAAFAVMAVLGLAATSFFGRIPEGGGFPECARIPGGGRIPEGSRISEEGNCIPNRESSSEHGDPSRDALRRETSGMDPFRVTPKAPSLSIAARAPWWRGTFGAFALGLMTWTLGTTVVSPFYVVHMTRSLGLDAGAIGLLTAFSTAAQLVGFVLLGPQVDRRGNRGTLILSAGALALVPLGWLLVRAWPHILPLYLLSGIASAGMNLASLNMLLELSPEESRASHASAYYSALAVAAIIAPQIGGWLFARWGFGGAALAGGVGGLVGVAILVLLLGRAARRADLGA